MIPDLVLAAQGFKALSDSTRLRILVLLKTDTLCVMDIVTILDLPQPMISRHLTYLQKKGLIVGRKQGLWRFFNLNRQSPVVGPLNTFLKENSRTLPSLVQDQKKAAELKRKGGCCPKTQRPSSCL